VPEAPEKEEMPSTAGSDLDREVAEWVLSVGGSLVVDTAPDNPSKSVATEDDLPKEAFTVRQVILHGTAAQEQLVRLMRLQHLSHLELRTNVSDATLDAIASASRTASATTLSLRYLLFSGTQVTDAGLKHLSAMTSLRDVHIITGAERITDAGVDHLSKLPNLTALRVDESKITGTDVSKWPNLTQLTLYDSPFADAGLANLKGLRDLWLLSLDKTQITDGGLQHLEGLNNLRHLSLVGTNVSDEAVDVLQSLKSVKTLNLTGTKITAEGIQAIKTALPDCKVVCEGAMPSTAGGQMDREVAEWVLGVGGFVLVHCFEPRRDVQASTVDGLVRYVEDLGGTL
jgi:hypothetical protein